MAEPYELDMLDLIFRKGCVKVRYFLIFRFLSNGIYFKRTYAIKIKTIPKPHCLITTQIFSNLSDLENLKRNILEIYTLVILKFD